MAVVAVAAEETAEDDVDRTDFTEEHLKSDEVKVGTIPHSDIEPAWIFPEASEGKLPVGDTTDLLVALANGGAKMFNVSHVEARLLDASGKLALKLPRFEYGQPLGPLEQRSYRYPIPIDEEAALGEYTLVAKVHYNTRDKEPFVSLVCNETVELVPPLPSADAQLRMVQAALGIGALLLLALFGFRAVAPAADAKSKPSKKKAAAGEAASGENPAATNEWLSGTLAGSERKSPKKAKKA